MQARSKCRYEGVSMASADAIIAAFHSEHAFNYLDIALAVRTELQDSTAGEKKQTSGETKGDSKAGSSDAKAFAARRFASKARCRVRL